MKQISKSFSNFYVLASVLGARCSVLGARCSVLGARCSVLGARCSVLITMLCMFSYHANAQLECDAFSVTSITEEHSFILDCKPVAFNLDLFQFKQNNLKQPADGLLILEVTNQINEPSWNLQQWTTYWQHIEIGYNPGVELVGTELFISPNPQSLYLIGKIFKFRVTQAPWATEMNLNFSVKINSNQGSISQTYRIRARATEFGCPDPVQTNDDPAIYLQEEFRWAFPPFPGTSMLDAVNTWINPLRPFLYIQNPLNVDVDYALIGDIANNNQPHYIYFREGASIVVNPGRTLTLKQVDIYTCDHLAHGIIVEPGGTLIADEVNFRDSRFAIDARPGSKIDIRNSNFQNNYLGLNAQLAPGDAPVQVLGFANNTFTTTEDGVKLPYTGMPEQVGAVGFAGIRAENNNDFNSWSPNTFNNLANGILLRNSNSNLDNLTMTNMVADAAYPVSGFGVNTVSENNTSFLILGRHGVSSFNGVGTAVAANRIGGEVSNCQITDAETGIRWQNSPNRDKLLLNNNITAKVRGIDSYRCEPNIVEGNFNSRMQNNTINAPEGIRASETSSTFTGKGWRIFNNNITSSGNFQGQNVAGILYGLGKNGLVKDNIITTSGQTARGIDAVLLKKSTISKNTTTGTNDNNNIGILLRNNTDLVVECNIPIKSQVGIRLSGPNGGTRLKTNRFAQLATGLEYGSSAMQTAFTGAQIHHGNVWYNESVTLGAKHWETPSNPAQASGFIVDIPESLIEIDPTSAKSFMPSTREPMFAWFQNFPDDTLSAYCNTPLSPVPVTPGSEWHVDILNGTYQPSIFKEAQLYKLRSDVMQKIAETPLLTLGNTAYQNFQANYSGSVLQKHVEASFDKNSLFEMGGAQATNWLTLYQLMRTKSDALATLDKQLQAGAVISSSLYNQKKQEYATARQEFEQLNAGINSQKSIMAGAYKAENGLINPSTIWETNQIVVNDIQFRLVQTNQELTGQEMKTLEFIASQCPLLGGDAVFEARALLSMRTDLQYDDDTQCQADIRNNAQNREGVASSKALSLVIYPNPTNGYILLDAYMGKRLFISDVYGRVFLEKDILSPKVDVSHLPSGMYQVCVFDDFTRLMCGNLMVTDK